MLQGRTVLLYARTASAAHNSPAKPATNVHRSPECVKKYARVAYVILCNSVWKVRYNECTHGDEKPPPPIRDSRVYRGKDRTYGGKERVQGRRGWSPRRGVGAEPPPTDWTILFYFREETKILIRKSKKFIRKKTCKI